MPELSQGNIQLSRMSQENRKLTTSLSAPFAKPLSLVAPGGGLKQLDLSLDDTDYIFDAIFATRNESNDSGYDTSERMGSTPESDQLRSFIRTYSNDEDM